MVEKNGVDVFDGPGPAKVDTNPFTNISGPSSVNPFNCYLKAVDDDVDTEGSEDAAEGEEEESLVRGKLEQMVEELLHARIVQIWLRLWRRGALCGDI